MTIRILLTLASLSVIGGQALTAQVAEKTATGTLQKVGEVALPAGSSGAFVASFGARGTLALALTNKEPFLLIDSTLQKSMSIDGKRSPSEVREADDLIWSGDSVGVLDNSARRVSFYHLDGKPAGIFALTGWRAGQLPIASIGGGDWLAQRSGTPRNVQDVSSRDTFAVVIASANPAESHDLFVKETSVQIVTIKGPNTTMMLTQPRGNMPIARAARITPGMVILEAADATPDARSVISVSWVTPTGAFISRRTGSFPVTLLGNDRDKYIADLMASMRKGYEENGRKMDDITDELSRKLNIPSFTAPLNWLQVDRSGDAWFLLKKPNSSSGTLCRAPMKDGEVTCADMPAGMSPIAADIGGRIILTERDAQGKVALHEYRLR